MKKFFVETFGCTANTAGTELMLYQLKKCGYKKTSEITNADFVIINTCIVKAPTESKIKSLIKKLYLKYPLVIAGCLPQVLSDWCDNFVPKAALLGVDHFGNVCQAADSCLSGKKFSLITRNNEFCSEISRDRFSHLTGIIEISKGCTGECSYCIVKIAKGKLVSKSKDMILKEVKKALNDGCKEIWLTAQDTASYGIDKNTSLVSLLEELISLPDDFMIRIGMMNADYAALLVDDLIDLYKSKKIYSFIHLPLQSASNRILKKMKRKYTFEEYSELLQKMKNIPNLTISTDIIAGYPGETIDDFNQTVKALKEFKFDIVNLSKYGDRYFTLASKSDEKLPTEIIKNRSRKLTKIIHKLTLEKNKQWIGWEGTALALKKEKNDKITLLRNKSYKMIAIKNSSLKLGQKYLVKIIAARKTRLIGEVINN